MRFSIFIFLIIALLVVLAPQINLAKERKNPFLPVPHYNYKTQKIGNLKSGDDTLVMERAYIHAMGENFTIGAVLEKI